MNPPAANVLANEKATQEILELSRQFQVFVGLQKRCLQTNSVSLIYAV